MFREYEPGAYISRVAHAAPDGGGGQGSPDRVRPRDRGLRAGPRAEEARDPAGRPLRRLRGGVRRGLRRGGRCFTEHLLEGDHGNRGCPAPPPRGLRRRRRGRDSEGLHRRFAPDHPRRDDRGLGPLREAFTGFFGGLFAPGPTSSRWTPSSEGEVAFISWHATCASSDIPLGVDTFLVRDGKIAVQTYAAKVDQVGEPRAARPAPQTPTLSATVMPPAADR